MAEQSWRREWGKWVGAIRDVRAAIDGGDLILAADAALREAEAEVERLCQELRDQALYMGEAQKWRDLQRRASALLDSQSAVYGAMALKKVEQDRAGVGARGASFAGS
jgi:hypothetical protein